MPPSRAPRQHDRELGERARLGRDLDRPAMLLDDDVMAKRQAKPGALARGLGGEERIEHFRLHLVGDAGAVVANRDFDACPTVARRGGRASGS